MADNKELYGYDEEDIITLEYDDGAEEECGILGVFDALGKEYIALNPLGQKTFISMDTRNTKKTTSSQISNRKTNSAKWWQSLKSSQWKKPDKTKNSRIS